MHNEVNKPDNFLKQKLFIYEYLGNNIIFAHKVAMETLIGCIFYSSGQKMEKIVHTTISNALRVKS